MRVINPKDFIGAKAWDALDIEKIKNASIRLHWTNEPYIWHVNDGPEVFVVLEGAVDMHVRDASGDKVFSLQAGDIFHAETGDEHKAVPIGAARILVIETDGSI
ncbi:cupin domain-containing protein [Sneathiella marina]|uniref:Cupin domain-containing protein n=1 Tax=Sneathiella marina TaxID=2950108 RepID=A0ABY4W423_9PROT|nr:cupin domain-containing protein [Sneathiella marina]USG60475.1 cupin domain-containing protein [Sneathiella marina]